MIVLKRLAALMVLLVALAACSVEPPLDPGLADTLQVRNVSVASSADVRTVPGITPNRLAEDVGAAVTREIKAVTSGRPRPVDVRLVLTRLSLHSTLPGAVRTYPYSEIEARLTVIDVATGQPIIVDKTVSGNDNVGAHSLASATAVMFSMGKPIRQAYDDTVKGFAADLRRQFFEYQGFETLVN